MRGLLAWLTQRPLVAVRQDGARFGYRLVTSFGNYHFVRWTPYICSRHLTLKPSGKVENPFGYNIEWYPVNTRAQFLPRDVK